MAQLCQLVINNGCVCEFFYKSETHIEAVVGQRIYCIEKTEIIRDSILQIFPEYIHLHLHEMLFYLNGNSGTIENAMSLFNNSWLKLMNEFEEFTAFQFICCTMI